MDNIIAVIQAWFKDRQKNKNKNKKDHGKNISKRRKDYGQIQKNIRKSSL